MDIGLCFERSITVFKRNPAPFLIGALVILIANVVIGFLGTFIPGLQLLGSLLSGLLFGGLTIMGLKARRQEPIDVPDVFAAFQRPVPYIVVNLAVLAGALACGVGLFVTGFLFMFSVVFVARGADFGPALLRSKDVVLANVGDAILLLIVLVGLYLSGVLVCGVGFVLTAPLAVLVGIEGLEQLESRPQLPPA